MGTFPGSIFALDETPERYFKRLSNRSTELNAKSHGRQRATLRDGAVV